MAVKIFAKISYNINGVASPSIILASAWVDELNKLDTDERKIANFVLTQGFSFFTSLGNGALEIFYPESMANEFMYSDEVQDDFLGMFGFVENEKYPFDKYTPVIGSIGEYANAKSLAFIMNNLAYATANDVDDIEPEEVFFYIHKLTADEIDSFADSRPEYNDGETSVTDLYDLLLPHVATKNGTLEAKGFRQATQNGNAIVLYADCITYLNIENPGT